MPLASKTTALLVSVWSVIVNALSRTVMVGVVSVGLVPNTSAPDPVSSVTADARFALDGVARNVATPAARPETPVEIGNPVQFVNVPLVGVPRTGVTRVGDVAKTSEPDPVSLVTADAKLADDGVARNAATFAARPETPVEIGRPVQLVSVPLAGVPSAGVTSVGDVAKTSDPDPVSSEMTPANSAEVVAAKAESLLDVSATVPLASGTVSVLVVAVVIPDSWNWSFLVVSRLS
jgi:hypothetical protein